jgi:hypothetical protein
VKKAKERMKQSKFPKGWDEEKVHRVLRHYEKQTEEEALAEDEAAYILKGPNLDKRVVVNYAMFESLVEKVR